MNTQEPTTYNLGSSGLVSSPGVFMWLQALHLTEPERAECLLAATWNLPLEAAEAVLSGAVSYTIDHTTEVVTFTYPTEES